MFYITDKSQFTFKIPSTVPAGDYLLRIEHIAIHGASTAGGVSLSLSRLCITSYLVLTREFSFQAQFYISCANLKITGGGSASPAKVSIPG